MSIPAACEDRAVMNPPAATALLLKWRGSTAAEALDRGLRAAGVHVATVATAYDVVAEAARLGDALRYLIVGVDPFGPGEFRLLPLVRREWPTTVIVAYHSCGFEYKGRLAELVGADIILSAPDAVASFVESVAPQPAAPPPVTREPEAAPASNVETHAPSKAPQSNAKPPPEPAQDVAAAIAEEVTRTEKSGPQAAWQAPADLADELVEDEELPEGEPPGTVELTEEELRLLLSEDEGEDEA